MSTLPKINVNADENLHLTSQQLITEAAAGSREIRENFLMRISTIAASVVLFFAAGVFALVLAQGGGIHSHPGTQPGETDEKSPPEIWENYIPAPALPVEEWTPKDGYHVTRGQIGDIEIAVSWYESLDANGYGSVGHEKVETPDSDIWEIYEGSLYYSVTVEVLSGEYQGFYLFDLRFGKVWGGVDHVLRAVGIDPYNSCPNAYSRKYMWSLTASDTWEKALVLRFDEISEDEPVPYKLYCVDMANERPGVVGFSELPEVTAACGGLSDEYPYTTYEGRFTDDGNVLVTATMHDSVRSVMQFFPDASIRFKYSPADGSVTVLETYDYWAGDSINRETVTVDGVTVEVLWEPNDIGGVNVRLITPPGSGIELISYPDAFKFRMLLLTGSGRLVYCYPKTGEVVDFLAEEKPKTWEKVKDLDIEYISYLKDGYSMISMRSRGGEFLCLYEIRRNKIALIPSDQYPENAVYTITEICDDRKGFIISVTVPDAEDSGDGVLYTTCFYDYEEGILRRDYSRQ